MASRSEKAPEAPARNGVQSADTVLLVLSSFVGAEPEPMLRTLADRTGLHPAKVHRYLVSLSRMGYTAQDPETSRYRLGPAALRLGMAAMTAVDPIRVTRPLMHGFCRSIGHAVVLAVWTDAGPTITLRETAPAPITINAAEGSIPPMLRSAIGRAFGAWLPDERTSILIDRELAVLARHPATGCPSTREEVDALFRDVRRRGVARSTGQLSAGVHALAAPIFGADGQLTAVLCTLGSASDFDSTWSGTTARRLAEAAKSVSSALGFEA